MTADTSKEQGARPTISLSVVAGTTWKCRGTAVHVECTVRFTKFSEQTSDELVLALF